MRFFGLLMAAGRSERFGQDKLALPLGDRPVWRWAYDALASAGVESVGIVGSEGRLEDLLAHAPGAAFCVPGGASRRESVARGLAAIPDGFDAVLVHDAARPFAPPELVQQVMVAVGRSAAAAPGTPLADTVKRIGEHGVETLDRSRLVAVQTPQGACLDLLRRAHAEAAGDATDDLALLEAIGVNPEIVPGTADNFKITTMDDYRRAVERLGAAETRTGIGYDVHRFSSDPTRPLMLGGVRLEGPGLEGHSDADAVLHAVVDAILGAVGLGDIGDLYPPGDPQWRNAPSLFFLKETGALARNKGFEVVSIDISVIAEHPKLTPHKPAMKQAVGQALGIGPDRVGIKATTNEGMGALGRGEGIAAFAVATLRTTTGGIKTNGSFGSQR